MGFKHAFHMSKAPMNPARGAVLRMAREQKGKKLREVGEAIAPHGVTPQAVSNWEAGAPISMPSLISACLFLEIDALAANEGRLVPKSNPGLAPADATAPEPVGFPETGPRDIDVKGVTVGGDDADFYFNGETINRVGRPAGLAQARNVFALTVVGESVSPRYFPGELIFCQKVTALPGDYIVIEMYPEREGEAGKSFVKRLVRRQGGKLICEQHTPQKIIEFDMGLVKNVFRVIPPNELYG